MSQIDDDRANYRRFYDSGLSALLSAIWGGSLHMGLFEAPTEPLPLAQNRLKDRLAESARLEPSQRVIEAACGVGATAIHLAQTYGVQVLATNIADVQLSEARERAAAAGVSDRVKFAFADFHDLGGPSGTYDCWWCQEALLYARDRVRVFEEARRVVKPGGRIVFTDLTLSRTLPAGEREAFMADIRAPHLWAIEDYDGLLEDMRFELVEWQDWSPHAAWTFAAVARNLRAVRERFAASIGEEAVRGTEHRIDRQLAMASAGMLGWCFFALKA